jgi:hypothetical protein
MAIGHFLTSPPHFSRCSPSSFAYRSRWLKKSILLLVEHENRADNLFRLLMAGLLID